MAYVYRLGTFFPKKNNRLLVYLFSCAQHVSVSGRK